MALQGTLDTFALADVLRLLATTAKTGRLRVEGDRGHGDVWLRDGTVMASSAERAIDGAPSEEIVFELLRFEVGSFDFELDEPSPNGEQPEDVEVLLRDANALLSEWKDLEKVVPSLEHQVTLVDTLPGDDVTIAAEHWPTVVAVGTGSSVGQLASALTLGELGVTRKVRDLVELGVVSLDEPTPGARRRSLDVAPPPDPSTRTAGPRIAARSARSALRRTGETPRTDAAPRTEAPVGPAAAARSPASAPARSWARPTPPAATPASSSASGGSPIPGPSRCSPRTGPTAPTGPTTRTSRRRAASRRRPACPRRRPRRPSGPAGPASGRRATAGPGRSGPRPRRATSPPPAPPRPRRRPTPPLPATPRLGKGRSGSRRSSSRPPTAPASGGPAAGSPFEGTPTGGSPFQTGSTPAVRPFDTGGMSVPPLYESGSFGAAPLPADTGQIRPVSPSALPPDLHWAADDGRNVPFGGPAAPVPPAMPADPGKVAPHVAAMSPEARAAVQNTVGNHGGTNGGPAVGEDLADRGQLLNFLSSVRP